MRFDVLLFLFGLFSGRALGMFEFFDIPAVGFDGFLAGQEIVSGKSAGDVQKIAEVAHTATSLIEGLAPILAAAQQAGPVFAAAGLSHLVSAALGPMLRLGLALDWPPALTRLIAGCYLGAWSFGLPSLAMLALLLFPDGHLPGRWWRAVAGYLVALGVLGLVLSLINPYDLVAGEPASRPLFAIEGIPMAAIEAVVGWLSLPAMPLVLASLILRYRRGDERVRRQLLWLLLALIAMLVINLPRTYDESGRPDGFRVRRAAIDHETPLITDLELARAVVRLPTAGRALSGITKSDSPEQRGRSVRLKIYCDRTVRAAMDVQAIRDKNVLLSPTDYAGKPVVNFRNIEIGVTDALLNTESRVV